MPARRLLLCCLTVAFAVAVLATGLSRVAADPDETSPMTLPAASEDVPTDRTPKHASRTQHRLAKVVAAPVGKPVVEAPASSPLQGALHPRVRAAYEHAQQVAATRWRGCGLRWTVLAALGAVESANAAHHPGAVVLEDSGRILPLIFGPTLDGRGGRGLIADSDGGELDEDPNHDRAIGPLQFIPDTWRRHGHDGNDDGTTDPHSIDDAALTAASYLCTAARGSLRDPEALDRAIFSYNHSDAYVLAVRDQLDRFDTSARLPRIPRVEVEPEASHAPAPSDPPVSGPTPPPTPSPPAPTTAPPTTAAPIAPPTTPAPPTTTAAPTWPVPSWPVSPPPAPTVTVPTPSTATSPGSTP